MSSSAPPPALRGRLPGLDALRALAITLVLGYHLFPGLLPGGFVGVDVFFVVSGYLITALLLAEWRRDGRIDLRAFWTRRARRLLPALVLVVLSTASLAALIGGDVLVGMGWQLIGAATFTSNWVAVGAGASYLDQTSPELLRHLWSLAVEEQFYLLWPLLLLGLFALPVSRRMRAALPLALAVASVVAMAALAGAPSVDGGAAASAAYLSSLTHGFGLLTGAAVALWRDPLSSPAPRARGAASSLVAACAVLAVVTLAAVLSIGGEWAYRGGMAAVVVLTVVAIIALESAAASGGGAARLADHRGVRWLGERSYSLYLWHWPLWVLALAAAPALDRTGPGAWGVGAIVLAVSLACAEVTYRAVERPARTRTLLAPVTSGSPRRRAAVALAASLSLASLVAGTAAAVHRAPTTSEAAALIAAGERALEAPAQAGPRSPEATTDAGAQPDPEPPADAAAQPETDESEPDEPAPLPPGDTITAVGDSVMVAAAPALQAAFPGIAIDAEVGRQMRTAPAVIAALRDAGVLRDTVVLALGTNGTFAPAVLDEVRALVGERHLVVVTAQAPRDWTGEVNQRLAQFADAHYGVELADWRAGIASRLELLAGDQIHPGPTGGEIYAAEVRAALQRLAELPPPPDPDRYVENPELTRPV